MNTPIADFVRKYSESGIGRLHMPGHKGRAVLGCEHFDITEVNGADALYEADGIIAEAESNATELFGTRKTLFSTEGSSQCIRAMLYLALLRHREKSTELRSSSCAEPTKSAANYQVGSSENAKRPKVVAARNVHKSFVYAAALLDFEPVWLLPDTNQGICSCPVTAEGLRKLLAELDEPPACVYLTSPDYLGGQQDISAIAEVCHSYGTILAVDNAHGAYLHFLEHSAHPIDLGADICCDSAHKTLPVLTGGAYLHIANAELCHEAKNAMALFGSTSPSYLTLMSLDLCNAYLCDGYREKLSETIKHIDEVKGRLIDLGWRIYDSDPLKLTIEASAEESGVMLAEKLRKNGVEAEFSDPDYLVLMITPQNAASDIDIIPDILGKCCVASRRALAPLPKTVGEQAMSVRDAVFAVHETIPVASANGRICGAPTVACPPAIPIAVSGERIGEQAIGLFKYYDIKYVDVVRM